MRAHLASFLIILGCLGAPTGCASLFSNASAQTAEDALTYSAIALRILNNVAEKHIDGMGLPTPEQLEQAASVVRDLQGARHALELAGHDVKASDPEAAREHVKEAILRMRGAADTLKQLGANVKDVQAALSLAERFL